MPVNLFWITKEKTLNIPERGGGEEHLILGEIGLMLFKAANLVPYVTGILKTSALSLVRVLLMIHRNVVYVF